ncbi:uncharacterized protein LOC129789050 [Lutzomyia longipalpis]|uniref:uncharacterized protein LOC129789050 n=1 Tax=Lutzomyia longipalpis TaxID=7200 RepID=UPI0024845156|nr:uncharacterized protein LOC129789050 [Lutzomyia longipalpis]
MDVENDLEEQLTSYHICKLPTESLPDELNVQKAIKTEIEVLPVDEEPPKKRRLKRNEEIQDTTWLPSVPQASRKTAQKSNYRLEVFTVESARTTTQIPEEPPEEILSASPGIPNYALGSIVNLRTQAQPGNTSTSRASASNGRSAAASSTAEQGFSSKIWYQLPGNEDESVPVQASPQISKRNPVQTQPPVVKLNLPLQIQPSVVKRNTIPLNIQASVINSNTFSGQLANVLRTTNLPLQIPSSQIQALTQQSQGAAPKNLRKRQNVQQNTVQSPPVVTIKIEDDDDDVSVVNAPPPAPIRLVEPAETRHIIKLVTSVPVSKYPCEFCGCTFELWNQRDTHMATHRIDGEYICFICQKAVLEYYITEDSVFRTPHYHFLQAHLAESHKITGQPRGFECPYCSIHPANYAALVQHLTQDHDTSSLRNQYILVNVLEDRLEG